MNRRPWFLLLCAGLIAGLVLLPIAYLILRTAQAGPEAWELLLRPRLWKVFANSALLALTTTFLSVCLGVPLAWLTVRSDLPFRKFWSVVGVLPLAIPSYIMAYAFIAFLGPKGLLAEWLSKVGINRMP